MESSPLQNRTDKASFSGSRPDCLIFQDGTHFGGAIAECLHQSLLYQISGGITPQKRFEGVGVGTFYCFLQKNLSVNVGTIGYSVVQKSCTMSGRRLCAS